jgi:hypothetical protein
MMSDPNASFPPLPPQPPPYLGAPSPPVGGQGPGAFPVPPPAKRPSRVGGIVALIFGALSAACVVVTFRRTEEMYYLASTQSPMPHFMRQDFLSSTTFVGGIALLAATAMTFVALLSAVLGRRALVGKISLGVVGLVIVAEAVAWPRFTNAPRTAEMTPAERRGERRGAAPPSNAPGMIGKYTTRQVTWTFGRKLSLAALARTNPRTSAAAQGERASAETLARALETTVPSFPALQGGKAKDTAAAIHYLLETAGKPIALHLRIKFGQDHAALFELAVKAQLLSVLYSPGDETSKGLASSLERLASRAELPAEVVAPVVKAVRQRASEAVVTKELERMEAAIQVKVAP